VIINILYRFCIFAFLVCLVLLMEPEHLNAEPLIKDIVLRAMPSSVKKAACPVNIHFIGAITAGTTMYKSELLFLKYRLIGDKDYSSKWHKYSIKKGKTISILMRRSIGINQLENTGSKNTESKQSNIYIGWSALEVHYQDINRNLYRTTSNLTRFTVECEPFPDSSRL